MASDAEILQAVNDAKVRYHQKISPYSGTDIFATQDRLDEIPTLGGESLVGNIIDVLSRGEYASANIAKDYIMGKPFDVNAAIEGLTGERKETYDNIVDKTFPEMGLWRRKALGFFLSVFADPTTYFPAKLVVGGIQKGGEALGKISSVGKFLDKLDNTPVSKAFRPKAGLPEDYYELKYYSKKFLDAENERILSDVESMASGLSREDTRTLTYLREHPNEPVPPDLASKLEEIGKKFDGLVYKAVDDGIIAEKTAQKWLAKDVPYVARYYPEQGYRLAKGELPPTLFEKVKKPTFLKKRTFETTEDAKALANEFLDVSTSKTLGDAKEKIAKYGLGDAYGRFTGLDFEGLKKYSEAMSKYYTPNENIYKAYALRASEQAAYTARTKFIDNVLEQFGTKIEASTKILPEGYGKYYPKGAIRF
ncbi:hypothetical protein KY333_06060, partial [Candidatus Woesearchaeota archaeon]|nr:hypothetical protein [Candidatus Woesearchaeota archaeon]